MNLTQLEVFIAIVDTGSLKAAAEVVGLTQSAVSHALKRLESELGVTLIERGRQESSITGIGQEVIIHARQIMTHTEVIRQKTSRERGLSSGKIRFGIAPTISGRLLTGIMRDFDHKFPEIEIILFEGHAPEIAEWLETDVIDIGIALHAEHYKKTVLLATTEVKILLSQKHPLAAQASLPFQVLLDNPLIGPPKHYQLIANMMHQNNITMPHFRFPVSAYSTIITMVRENMGISLMPDKMYDEFPDGVVAISLTQPIISDIYLVTHSIAPAVQAFMKNAAQWSKDHGYLQANT